MTRPEPAVEVDELPWRRLSGRMLIIHPAVELVRAIPALAGILLAGTQAGAGSLWGLVGVVVVVALALTRWFTTRYRISPEQVQLRRGLVRRQTFTAPLDRIRTVDVTAHLLHRALGLAKVVIGTGTSDRRGRGGLVLDGLDAADAARLRAELLHRSVVPAVPVSLSTPAAPPVLAPGADPWVVAPVTRPPDTAPLEQELARLQLSWLRFAPFSLSGAAAVLALAGLAWRVISDARIRPDSIGPLRSIAAHLRRTSLWIDAVQVGVALLLLVALASTVGYLLSFWGFTLTRHPEGSLQVRRGLLTTRTTSLEQRRLRGAELSESLLLRAVGGARCLSIATGLRVGRGAERGGTVLLPPAPRREALRVCASVLGSVEPFAARLTQHGELAARRRYRRALVGAVLIAAAGCGAGLLAGNGPAGAWSAAVLVPAAWLLAADRYRNLGHAFAAGHLVTRYGSLIRRHSAIDADGVVGWNIRRSYFQRRAGLATLTATTAAGRQGYRIPDVPLQRGEALAATVTPGLLEDFR